MPRGRRPDGENALTGAERQARYRANQQARQGMPTSGIGDHPIGAPGRSDGTTPSPN